MRLKNHLMLFAGMVAIWCLLSGHYSALLLSIGVLSCMVGYAIYQKIAQQTNIPRLKLHPLKQTRYTFWLIGEIIKSNFAVIGAIVNTKKLEPQFFEVDASGLNESGQVMYANSITRTPGTVSTDITQTKIQVHALLASSKAGLMDNKMLAKVRQLGEDK